MESSKADILQRLKKDLIRLEGYKHVAGSEQRIQGLEAINQSFPQRCFPLGVMHEFINASPEQFSASCGFLSGVIGQMIGEEGVIVWIGKEIAIFPPALKQFGIPPERVLFVSLRKDNELLWAMEECLKTEGLSAVVAEVNNLSFTASRRLQLAVESSRVTGFLIRKKEKHSITSASQCRWEIEPTPSAMTDDTPGIGFPRWIVRLLKVRNGKPGEWIIEWKAGSFSLIESFKQPLSNFDLKKAV